MTACGFLGLFNRRLMIDDDRPTAAGRFFSLFGGRGRLVIDGGRPVVACGFLCLFGCHLKALFNQMISYADT